MSDVIKVLNKETGIVHTVPDSHPCLNDPEKYEVVKKAAPKKRKAPAKKKVTND